MLFPNFLAAILTKLFGVDPDDATLRKSSLRSLGVPQQLAFGRFA